MYLIWVETILGRLFHAQSHVTRAVDLHSALCMPVIHVSPVDHSGLVRCYLHELETTLKYFSEVTVHITVARRTLKIPSDWADELISGTPHQPPPDIPMQNNSSEKTIENPANTSYSCLEATSTAHSRDANIFRASQSPPSNFLLSPLLNESGDISDSALEAHDTPTREFRKRTRELNTDEESDYDLSNSPSYKGKKKANNAVFPRDGNVTTTLSSQKLADLMKEFQGYPEYTAKLERQVKALIKSNAAKALKIQELQTALENAKKPS
ncbi:hypothetical protein D9757_000727 [Collybiopsis confluens]|uniref:Uncharacterized protein n=1 Tax=Collybiopsis confluens TaxID=2823264 RepID=A0A8H5I1L3_9AGAR|nr:hypothetical protein D9757_000727 [Collybiopsis confluens]